MDRLIAEYPDTIERSVELSIMTPEEAEAALASFGQLSIEERQRAVLRERWRQIDTLEVNGQVSADDAATARDELLKEGSTLGFGEPPW
jgi:hypothetical protein